MRELTLLREFLRTCRRVKRQPSLSGLKKIEYLRFIGANACPACGEEVDPEVYVCRRDTRGQLVEYYRCPNCGSDYIFSDDPIH